MSSVILIVSIVILLIAVVLFLKKPKNADGISEADLLRQREENNRLQITLAKAEERASGLALERDKADKLLQDERIRYDDAVTNLKPGIARRKKPDGKSRRSI